jgi:hypothetical protein
MQEIFVPASEEDIATYRDNQYPQWLESCRRVLAEYHNAVNAAVWPPTFYFAATNQGTRPAKDALITIEAQGSFLIMPPPSKNGRESEDDGTDTGPPALPRPPRPPRGQWQSQHAGTLGAFQDLARAQSHWFQPPRGLDIQSLALRVPDARSFHRDPNAFYYKPDRSKTPQPSFGLECAQWRHGSDDWERFPGEIHFAETVDQVTGILECRIHAENLSGPTVHRVPLRISVSSSSVFERAEILVQALITSGTRDD